MLSYFYRMNSSVHKIIQFRKAAEKLMIGYLERDMSSLREIKQRLEVGVFYLQLILLLFFLYENV